MALRRARVLSLAAGVLVLTGACAWSASRFPPLLRAGEPAEGEAAAFDGRASVPDEEADAPDEGTGPAVVGSEPQPAGVEGNPQPSPPAGESTPPAAQPVSAPPAVPSSRRAAEDAAEEASLARLPEYRPASDVVGSLTSAGSHTMSNLMTAWAADFRRIYPLVQIQTDGRGSNTAPLRLLNQSAMFGLMSRAMNDDERGAFEERLGVPMTGAPIGLDLVAVFVHRDNPLSSISLPQLDAVFSRHRRRGALSPATRWGDLGLTGLWRDRGIRLYGRSSPSGTYSFFRELVLAEGDYRSGFVGLPSSWSVSRALAQDRGGAAFASWVFRDFEIKALAVRADDGGPAVRPGIQTAWTREYPLARPLWIYFQRPVDRPLDPLRREFLRYVLSRRGQGVLLREGYVPLTPELAERFRHALGLDEPAGGFDDQ